MRFYTVLSLFISTLLATSVIQAQEIRRSISLRGTQEFVEVSSGIKKVIFQGVSKGNISLPFEVDISAPAGIRLKAFASQVKLERKVRAKSKIPWYPIKLYNTQKLQKRHSHCADVSVSEPDDDESPSPEDYPPIEHPFCDLLPIEDRIQLQQSLQEAYGGSWSLGNVCAWMVESLGDYWPENPDDLPPPPWETQSVLQMRLNTQSISRFGLLRKDSCSRKAKKYSVRFELDLRKVRWEELPEGATITFRAREFPHRGGMQAALKPESEGRYAPRPIVIMNWLGSNCGSRIDVVKWRKQRPRKTTGLNLYSYLYYRALILALATVDNALAKTKGRASVDLYSERAGYGVCMKMVRKRQEFNHYP